MAFFSVIIPVYNKVSTLSDSLECIYRQDFKDFEVIAVDDGSTDGSLGVLQRYEKAGLLRLFQRHSPGPGGYAARNLGADKSTGEWLVFFDADDIMLSDHLSCFANAIGQYSDVELYVNAYQKMEGQRYLPRIKGVSSGRLTRLEALEFFARFDFIHMNGACISRERFLSLGGFPAGLYRRGGDVYFWLKVLCELKAIHYNDNVTTLWLLENSDITRDKKNLIGLHPGVDLFKEYEFRLKRSERRQLRLSINRKVLSWAVEKKQVGQSVRLDLEALRLGGMNLRLFLHTISLLVPQPYYDQLRSRIK
ncbi:glycosyltransferase family A protein [Halomonas sp. GT]|uniref:glycosyltransferase family A protein n=1 Tax=Halomonas sp. GT TaxID=1971364 RepID=UPI0009F1B688|nr:glycosyltransferase family A protein [Halomonas sp. GT]